MLSVALLGSAEQRSTSQQQRIGVVKRLPLLRTLFTVARPQARGAV